MTILNNTMSGLAADFKTVYGDTIANSSVTFFTVLRLLRLSTVPDFTATGFLSYTVLPMYGFINRNRPKEQK